MLGWPVGKALWGTNKSWKEIRKGRNVARIVIEYRYRYRTSALPVYTHTRTVIIIKKR